MKPHQALTELQPLTQDKNAVTTKRFKKCYRVITAHVQMLEKLIISYQTELSIKSNANKRNKKQNKRYREALEFYADVRNHRERRGNRVFGDVFYDEGKKARKALEESE